MWRGIRIGDNASIRMEDQSLIADGAPGLSIAENAFSFRIHNSYIIDCATEIRVDPSTSGGFNAIHGEIYGTEFGLRNGFKPNYSPLRFLPHAWHA